MADLCIIVEDFGNVPCGVKVVRTIKFENKTENTQELEVHCGSKKSEMINRRVFLSDRAEIRPTEAVLQPKQTVAFKISYYSFVEDITENFSYSLLDGDTLIAFLSVRAKSVGPSLHPTVFNLKFFRFRDVNQTVKNIEITNKTKNEAKFQFDLDEDNQDLNISQIYGVIPGDMKFGLKLGFNPSKPGVYHRRVYCLVQFHRPLVFNITAIYKPKLKIEPKNVKLEYPAGQEFRNSYEAYMYKEEVQKLPEEKIDLSQKCLEGLDLNTEIESSTTDASEYDKSSWTLIPETPVKSEQLAGKVLLTNVYMDMKNSLEVLNATALLNYYSCQCFYFEWTHDPKYHFRVIPCSGVLRPNSKTYFDIYFSPSCMDSLYHAELELKVFRCREEEEETPPPYIFDLPLTIPLRIIGHSFSDGSCGWVPQCKITPKVLHLRTCVADEKIFGNFIMEREGHLPVIYTVMPTKIKGFSAHPPLGYLSRSFQLFVVQFDSSSLDPGIYEEDLKIKLNDSDANIETIRIVTTVELPQLVFGKDNSLTFAPIFPGSRISTTIEIHNPTHLDLEYEFNIPENTDWIEITNPKGSIESKGKGELEVIFKPQSPSSYFEYFPCNISSTYKPDYFETVKLQITGASQIGYLVATPSHYDLGECLYKEAKVFESHLFNFSANLLYFRLTAVSCGFPPSDLNDLSISPNKGVVGAKGSLKIKITLTPNNVGAFQYGIECQNFQDESDDAKPCEPPRKIISVQYEAVYPCIQIKDVHSHPPGPLFSPFMLWKMLCIDHVNEALRSVKSRQTIPVKIPEQRFGTSLTLDLLIECLYGRVVWTPSIQLQCPCYEASLKNVLEECLHTKAVYILPSKFVSRPLETSVLMLRINFDSANDSTILLTFFLPFKKEVILKMPLVSLPRDPPTQVSCYLNHTFHLRPVFIGDPHPPLQLFWLYNNSNHPASYLVDMEILHKKSEHNVIRCINPEGTIPPLSSHPLGFIFRPTEIITYSVNVELLPRRSTSTIIKLIGEGVLQVEPLKQIRTGSTAPREPKLHNYDLECCESYVNIPFVGIHSEAIQLFFIRNNSETERWSFNWHREKFKDIFSVTVEPEKGIVEPGKTARMMLIFRSFNHPTFVSYSLPCEISNYSQMTSYKESLRMQEMLAQRDEECFVITDKGLSNPTTESPKVVKPRPSFMFITVNANIVSNFNMEIILTQKLQYIPKAEKRMLKTSNFPLKAPVLECVREILEKIFWEILSRRSFAQKIKDSERSQNFVYKQIMPQSLKKTEEYIQYLELLPSQNFVQNILETAIEDLISKIYIPGKREKKSKRQSTKF